MAMNSSLATVQPELKNQLEDEKLPVEVECMDAICPVRRSDLVSSYPDGTARELFCGESCPYVVLPIRLRDYSTVKTPHEEGKLGDLARPIKDARLELYLPEWALYDVARDRPILPFSNHGNIYNLDSSSVHLANELRRYAFGARHTSFGGVVPGSFKHVGDTLIFWVYPDGQMADTMLVYSTSANLDEQNYLHIYAVRHGYRLFYLQNPAAVGVFVPIYDVAYLLNWPVEQVKEYLDEAIRETANKMIAFRWH